MMMRINRWLEAPQLAVRVDVLRIAIALVALGFMSSRIAHADEWIGDAGYHVPDLGDDWRQPLYVPALPTWAAWTVVTLMVASGLSFAAGFKTRVSGGIFASTLAFVALADRLAAFSVSKLSPVIVLAITVSQPVSRLSVDAFLKRAKRGKRLKPTTHRASVIRFVQLLPVVIYSASGIAKARGDWLHEPLVLWSHLHGSYQTWVTFALMKLFPAWVWTLFQGTTLIFETFAPIWFTIPRTRPYALLFGISMHVMIALMFAPVVWFSLLMITLLVTGYLPDRFYAPLTRRRGNTLQSQI